MALAAYINLSIIKAALSSVHGVDTIENKVSGYYIAHEISGTYTGMMIAIPEAEWHVFRQYTQTELVVILKKLAANVKLSRIREHPRGPKKPVVKLQRDPSHPHVSTARLLANRKK